MNLDPYFSRSAAENACINMGDKCGGFTLYQGQYYLKPGSIKFVASGPATCWTKEEKWANNYVPRAEWVSEGFLLMIKVKLYLGWS